MLEARSTPLASGDKLLELLERRLDNVVFRAGFAPTIPAARQLVNHGHMLVNGRRVDVASYRVGPGDHIRPRPSSLDLAVITESLQTSVSHQPDWIELDRQSKTAVLTGIPTSESTTFQVDVQRVVEYYAKRL